MMGNSLGKLAVTTVCFLASPALADVTGPVRVVDGDTIWFGKTKIRLGGIDAPVTCPHSLYQLLC